MNRNVSLPLSTQQGHAGVLQLFACFTALKSQLASVPKDSVCPPEIIPW